MTAAIIILIIIIISLSLSLSLSLSPTQTHHFDDGGNHADHSQGPVARSPDYLDITLR